MVVPSGTPDFAAHFLAVVRSGPLSGTGSRHGSRRYPEAGSGRCAYRPGTALGQHRGAVDRVVDSLGERRAVRALEERTVMVERQVGDAELRLHPELTLVDAVLLSGLGIRRRRDTAGGVVGRALLRAQIRRVERVADDVVDLRDVVGALALVVRVLLDRDRLVGLTIGDVVRACRRRFEHTVRVVRPGSPGRRRRTASPYGPGSQGRPWSG